MLEFEDNSPVVAAVAVVVSAVWGGGGSGTLTEFLKVGVVDAIPAIVVFSDPP